MSDTSSTSVPYWGTSSRYMADMAREKRERISLAWMKFDAEG